MSDVAKKRADVPMGSYKITKGKTGLIVIVTSGRLSGKSAKLIETPPSAAYFNERPQKASENTEPRQSEGQL
jgi:hypothetical protein